MKVSKTEGEGPTGEQANLLRLVYGAQAAQVITPNTSNVRVRLRVKYFIRFAR